MNNAVFIGGSRHVSRLSSQVQERLNNVIETGAPIIVGDANGADKAVQRFLSERAYPNVTVYCSGDSCRNNVGQWKTRLINPPHNSQGFEFYAAKDRVMAREAEFGLMIWDGKSAGTILNILRLIRARRKAVLINVLEKTVTYFKMEEDWVKFISGCTAAFRDDLRKRATRDEWFPLEDTKQTNFFDHVDNVYGESEENNVHSSSENFLEHVNAALAAGNPASVVEALGSFARTRGMSQVAKESGLARESLYRSLGLGGNPEFATILKVLSSMGLRLTVQDIQASKGKYGNTERRPGDDE
jgi:probable addiction module antidote protein